MARKKTPTLVDRVNNSMIDLTKTGPLSYRELQSLNNYLPAESEANQQLSIRPGSSDVLSRAGNINYTQDNSDFGSSIYDEELANQYQYDNYQDIRGERQPWYAKVGAGLAKGVILAGTTFLDGTIGLLVGGAQAIDEGRWSALWDNDFSKAMQYVNEASEEFLPNYYTAQEQESPWYENIFTANFLGDKFLKNLGFAVGAYYSGALLTKPIKGIGALAKASTLTKESKGVLTAAQAADRVKNITNATSMVSSGIGSITSAVNEGRIEALNNSTDWYNAQKELIDQAYETGELDDKQYAEALLQANDDRLKMGNADLLMNLPILTASNIIQFGKLYAGGMQTAKKGLNIVGNAGEWASGSSRLGNTWAITRGALSEGTEELTQGMASRIAGDYYATDVNNFIKAKTDPTASQETLSWIKSFAKGINDTVNDGSAWEEFFIGSLTGALGMPRFRGFKNEEGNWQSPVTIEGGAFNTWREFNEKRGEETQVAEYMNQRFNSPEFKNYYQGLVRHNKYQTDMNQAVENDDPFAYHNAEHGQMISDVMMFDKAGKLEDLVDMINNAFDTSDENLESIVKNTTSTAEDGKSVGPFVDENGNPAYSTERGKQEMIEQLTKSKDNILKAVDDYRASREVIMQSIPAGTHLTDDQLDELTWMHSQINNWSDRAVSMSGEIKNSLGKIIGDIDGEIAAWSITRTNEGMKSADLTDAYKEADKRIQELQQAKRTLEHVRGLDDEVLASSLSNTSNTDFVNTIQASILMLPESTMNMDKKEDVLNKLDDVKKLANGKEIFRNKLSEYLTDPSKQAADHQRAEQDNINEEQTRTRGSLVDALTAATDVSSFRNAMESSDLSQEDKQAVLQQMKDSGDPLANDYSNIEDYKREVRRALAQSNISDQAMQDAYQLLQDQYAASSNLEEMSNPNSVHINNDTAFDETSDTAELSTQRFQAAQYALQQAMTKVNNDNKFKDRFAQERPTPVDKTDNPDPAKGTSKDTTGDSGTATVPPVNGSQQSGGSFTPPVGNISARMVAEENRQTNTLRTESPDDLDSQQNGARPYYRPSIPELHIIGSKEGDFRPFNEVVKEREQGVNFDVIYNYLKDKGAFDYVNSGKLKVGDEIGFMIDPEFEKMVKDAPWHTKPTIFMVTKDGQIVGSLDDSDYSVAKFEGLAGLEERVKTEYAKWQQDKPFISLTQKTKVAKVMVGKVAYGDQERSLADIPNVRGKNGDKDPIFGIVKNGTISTNGAVSDSNVIKPVDMAQKEGRMYLLVPNGAGKYSPVAVRVKHFNTTEFNLDDATIADTPIAKDIMASIQRMAESTNDLDLAEVVKSLNKDLYLGNLHIDWFTSSQGNGIRFTQVERDADGNEVYFTDTDGKRKRKETVKTVFMTEKWDTNTVYSLGADNIPQTAPAAKDPSVVAKEITDILTGFNLPIQVSIDRLNTRGYANRLINSGVLTSNVIDARVIGTWFTTDYFDREGNLQSAVSPASVNPQQGRKIETPVGGKNSVTPGIPINMGNKTINVDLQNNVIYEDGKPRLIDKYRDQILVDLAWAQSIHGDRTEGHNMHKGCIVTPSGQVLNRATKQYLTGEEAQKIKDVIEGRNATQRERQEKAQQVVGRIHDAQQRVDKSRTDSEHYYILEDDGEYHVYDRVHTRLGSNWIESPKQTEALKHIQTTLSRLVDDLTQFDNHLGWLENKYNINLSDFRGKTDIKSREMIVSIIRDKMAGTNSTKALQAGSAVDTIIRQYFTTSDPSTITRPSNLTEEAFNSLINRFQQVKNNMEGQGMKFLTNNIVLYQKYPDGTRVAGEVDILAVDKDGNFRIYDVKTSRYSFGNFIDRYEHTVNYFENKSRTQKMSTKDYYTLQLSAYKNLFESQFGVPITQLAIMPFVLSYDKDTVSGITAEAGIPLTYNPSVNVPLVGSTKQEQPQPTQSPTQSTKGQGSPQSSAPIFDAIAETHNPTNMVIPEAAFSASGAQTGYYIFNGKVHRGYLFSIGEINGVPVHITKVPNITKGFGRQGEETHVASTNYVAVFPNGQTVTVMPNVTVDTEQQAIDKIKAALNGNPKRITEESAKETVLSKPQKSVEMSGSAKTIQAEQAISKKDPKRVRRRLREATDSASKVVWDSKKELAEVTRMLPQLSREDRIRFVKGLIRVADRGALAWGQMENGIITLSDIAAPGTAYHEAFHVVFNHLLEDNERAALLQEARSRFGKGLSEEELEEELAEEFRMFQMGEITDNRSIGRKILDFFKNLIAKTTNWKNFKPSSMAYYQAIRRGKYANKTLRDVTVSRLNREQYTQEMKDILANAPRDSQGRLLAPNGKPTKLDERQWSHVRTKAFKEWFGDWEKYAKLNNATVIWGHPASGKTYLFKQGREDIIDFDSEYKVRINKIMGLPEGANAKELRKAARKARKQEYHDLIMKLFDEAKAEAQRTGKKLLVSDMMLLKEREADIDVITNMSDEKFIERSAMRGETDAADKMLWKNDINDAMGKVSDKSKIINTEEFILDDLYGTNVSKIIDDIGEDATFEPLVVYHSNWLFNKDGGQFYNNIPKVSDFGIARTFFTTKDYLQYSKQFGENTQAYFLNVRNPYEYHRKDNPKYFHRGEWGTGNIEIGMLKNDGYDGAFGWRGLRDEYVVSTANQIKSATDNVGTYSRSNDDIRYRRLGEVRISTFDMVPQEERQILEKKGWTTEHFNRISQRERDKALECLGL